ncbi:hypothetical protein MMC13_005713 [Lambiella insularis]|nr:hypothetical protein [Lambiella insularis]
MVTTRHISTRRLLRRLHPQVYSLSTSVRPYLARPPHRALSNAVSTVKPATLDFLCYKVRAHISATKRSAFGPGQLTLILCGCVFGGTLVFYEASKVLSPKPLEDICLLQKKEEEPLAMVSSLLPGRPGNLTAEQELKLQELWKATLKVFGVPVLGAEENEGSKDESDDDVSEQSGVVNADKKKKKRGLFRRKKNEGIDKSTASSVVDSDDKYGQAKDFHQALATQSPEDLRRAFWSMVKHDHPDGLLLRFLRARKWDVDKALIMLISTMHWRSKEMHVDDDIMWNGEAAAFKDEHDSSGSEKKEAHDYMSLMRLGQSYLHGCDKEGRPLCIVRARLHKQGAQSEASLERVTVHIIETARLFLSPPVDTATILFDLTGFSMANMDYAPVKFMIKCFEANYPECLGVVLVHRSPWIFQGIWKIIKGWLDPVVAGKVHFTNSTEELAHYIPILHIPSDLGGEDSWTFKYVEPQPGENDKMADVTTRNRLQDERALTVKEFEKTTQEWIQGTPQADVELLKRREGIAKRLSSGYWVLDPYVRARTWYDRTGVIGKDGRIDYFPKAVNQVYDAHGVD